MRTKYISGSWKSIFSWALLCLIVVNVGCHSGIRQKHKKHKRAKTVPVVATTQGYEQILQSWVGTSELNLIRTWGAPEKNYITGGHKFLVYENVNAYEVPVFYNTTVIGDTAFTNSSGGETVQFYCTTTFEVYKNKVLSWQYKGNNCKAYPILTPTPVVDGAAQAQDDGSN